MKRNFNPINMGYTGKENKEVPETINIESGVSNSNFYREAKKVVKFKADRIKKQKQLQLFRQLERTERYEIYLQLKKEFEGNEV